MTKEERDKLYAEEVIKSFLPEGVKLEDCEYLVVPWMHDASRIQLEGQGCV